MKQVHNGDVRTVPWIMAGALALSSVVFAQTPQPFPPPASPQKPAPPTPDDPRTTAPRPPATITLPAPAAATSQARGAGPSEEMLGAPIYPSAVFLTSYDAGRGQRFYIFGVNARTRRW